MCNMGATWKLDLTAQLNLLALTHLAYSLDRVIESRVDDAGHGKEACRRANGLT